MNAELKIKLIQVRALLKAHKADAALLGLQPNFSWLACGGEAHIPLNSNVSFGQLVVTAKGFHVLASRIEMRSLQEEVVKGLGAKPLLWEWHDGASAVGALKQVTDPKKTLSDCGDWGTTARPDLFAPLHYSLQETEVKRYRALGRAAEAALNETCRSLQPGHSEFQIAGVLSERCWERNLTPVVVLVATDERIQNYRHPRPTTKKLRKFAEVVLCARQHGLIVALTRLVHFGPISKELRRRHDAVCAVDTELHLATQVGAAVKDVFRQGVAAYDAVGFADEWHLHHQGGPCGYQGRDYLGSPTAPGSVLENQPFAWNPSITGTKSEDTILATSKGPQVITSATDWPMVSVEGDEGVWQRPDILVR
ncbi:MAG: aminopeptidase P family protein [Limisphaerales bacterium]